MLLDLVSPWCAAVESSDPDSATANFRARHATLLRQLQRQRSPDDDELLLSPAGDELRRMAARVSSPALQQSLRDALGLAATLGADPAIRVALIAGTGSGFAFEALPGPAAGVALFVDLLADDCALTVALAMGLVAATRWSRHAGSYHMTEWNRWNAASEWPLSEWIYTTGIGMHLAAALLPSAEPRELLSLGRTAFVRLRDRERSLRALLRRDIDQSGIGLVLRWLAPHAPARARRVGRITVPPLAGTWLSWRMVAPRVARVGLAEALAMESRPTSSSPPAFPASAGVPSP